MKGLLYAFMHEYHSGLVGGFKGIGVDIPVVSQRTPTIPVTNRMEDTGNIKSDYIVCTVIIYCCLHFGTSCVHITVKEFKLIIQFPKCEAIDFFIGILKRKSVASR